VLVFIDNPVSRFAFILGFSSLGLPANNDTEGTVAVDGLIREQ
jgi:hypothetical protein